MPTQDIYINWAPQETRVAVVENGAVQELHIERTLEPVSYTHLDVYKRQHREHPDEHAAHREVAL